MPPPLTTHQARLLSGSLETGYCAWAGVKLIERDERSARLSFAIRDEMLTPWRTLNGGVVSSLVEVPSFVALLPTIGDDELPVTNDVFVQHVRPLPGDVAYEMTGRLLRRGRTMAWTEVTVEAAGEPVTLARITKTVLRRPA
jgi:uncharacterized protein (TIGR00369 family)